MKVPISVFRKHFFDPQESVKLFERHATIAGELDQKSEPEREKLAFQILGSLNRNHLEDGEFQLFIESNSNGEKPTGEWLATLIILADILPK